MRRNTNSLFRCLTSLAAASVQLLSVVGLSAGMVSAQEEVTPPAKQGTTKPPTTGETGGDLRGVGRGVGKGAAAVEGKSDRPASSGDFPGGRGLLNGGVLPRPGRSNDTRPGNAFGGALRDVADRLGRDLPRSTGPHPGAHLFMPTAYLRPRRLAPGEAGMLRVIVTLSKGNVVVPGSEARLNLDPANGQLVFGTPELAPPATGTLSTRYKGQLVYEDTLDFNVPVTVRAGAKPGSYPVRGNVLLALHDSNSAESRGKFTADLQGKIKIGAPLPKVGAVPPRPHVSSRVPGGSSATVKGATSKAAPVARNSAPAPAPAHVAGRREDAGAPLSADDETAEAAFDVQDSDDSLLLWLVGGVAGVLIVLLLLFRRR